MKHKKQLNSINANTFTIHLVDRFEELLALEQEWNLLLSKSETSTIFLTHEWITSWWRCFGQDRELFILTARCNDDIVGIAPLMIASSRVLGFEIKKVQFIGTPLSDYCDFIISQEKEEVLRLFYSYLLQKRKFWGIIQLDEIPAASKTLSLTPLILQSLTRYFDVSFSNTCLALDLHSSAPDYVKRLLKKRDIQRHINFFSKDGNLSFSKARTMDEAHNALNKLFDQHIIIWGQKGIPSMFTEHKYKEFFTALTGLLLPKEMIDIWVLEFDKKIISVQFGFNYNKKYLVYCHSYDMAYNREAPSMVLQRFFIKRYFDNGFAEVDFSRGNESYKHRFTNKSSSNFGIIIHKNMVAHIINKVYNKTKEKIMRNEKLHKLVIKCRSKASSFITRF